MFVITGIIGMWVGFAVAAARAPSSTAGWCAKEGPVEWVSVAVLAIGLAAWSIASVRRPWGARRRWTIPMVAFTAIVLGEELDWGIGANAHNVLGGHGYLLFAPVPALAVVTALRRAATVDDRPLRAEAIAMLVAMVPSLVSTFVAPAWADAMDEVGELALYIALAAWAVRVAAAARGQPA